MTFPKAATKIQPSEAKVGDLILAKSVIDEEPTFWIFRCTEVILKPYAVLGHEGLRGAEGLWDTSYAEFYRLDLDEMYCTVVNAEVM